MITKNDSAHWTELTCFHMHFSLKVRSSMDQESALTESALNRSLTWFHMRFDAEIGLERSMER